MERTQIPYYGYYIDKAEVIDFFGHSPTVNQIFDILLPYLVDGKELLISISSRHRACFTLCQPLK